MNNNQLKSNKQNPKTKVMQNFNDNAAYEYASEESFPNRGERINIANAHIAGQQFAISQSCINMKYCVNIVNLDDERDIRTVAMFSYKLAAIKFVSVMIERYFDDGFNVVIEELK